MQIKRLNSFGAMALVIVALGVACSDQDDEATGGTGGQGGSSAGSAGKAGSSNSAGSSGSGGSSASGSGNSTAGAGEGGADSSAPGGAAGQDAGGQGGAAAGGEGGSGGEAGASCETVREAVLGPIASVSTGLVEVTSDSGASVITLRVDASAGGYMAAASNPYIYVNLATRARVDVTDVQADSSTAWDLALKRDNLRANSGDSGPGDARVAVLEGVDFDAVTSADAATADFQQDHFIDAETCEPIVDDIGKPLTTFGNWYDYDADTMGLTPGDKVYLVRAANGTTLYKLAITGYYLDVSDGMGGTAKKSAVYSLKYRAL